MSVEYLQTGQGKKFVDLPDPVTDELIETLSGVSLGAKEEILCYARFRAEHDAQADRPLFSEIRQYIKVLERLPPADRSEVIAFARSFLKLRSYKT